MDLGRHLPFHRRWRWKSADLCESFTTDWKVSRCSVGSKSYGLIEAKRSALSSTAITVVSVWPPPGRSTYFFFVRPNTKKTLGGRRKPLQSAKGKKNTTQNKTYEMNQMTRQLGWPARNRWGKTVLGASAGSKVANGLGSLGRCCCWPRRAKKKWAETAPKLERQENDWRHITLRPIGPARIHPSSLLIATVYFFFTDPPSLPTPVHVQIAIFQFLSTSTALGVPARDLTTFSSFN